MWQRNSGSDHIDHVIIAVWLMIDGVPLLETTRLLGSSEAMVEQVYGKHSPEYLRHAASVLNLKKPNMFQL